MAKQRRIYKVAEKIRGVVAQELLRIADPRFHMVTVTSCVVSPDLRHAKIYWVVSGGKDRITEVSEAFETAGGFFRRAVAQELSIRFIPEIVFYYDDTLDTVAEVERLFERIAQAKT